jgi:glycolate oxidase FAD binding subunit
LSEPGDIERELQEQLRDAASSGTPLSILGGGSKQFLGRVTQAQDIRVGALTGTVAYEPTELVVTVRAGTPLAELENLLAERGQMLAFEPPHLGVNATIGGTVACGLSGPRRPYVGAARDFVLGTKILNGRGEVLSFGGQVMKNVAGYDVSRLMTGAMGTLGLILEVSLKVLPVPAVTKTLVFDLGHERAADKLSGWSAQPLPISGACSRDRQLFVRLSGTERGVGSACSTMGGEQNDDTTLWSTLKEQQWSFFDTRQPIWRLSLPPAAAPLSLEGEFVYDWGGALCWLKTQASANTIRTEVEKVGGHATAFRNGDRQGAVFHPLPTPLAAIHKRVKKAFDPHGVLNIGRMYPDL